MSLLKIKDLILAWSMSCLQQLYLSQNLNIPLSLWLLLFSMLIWLIFWNVMVVTLFPVPSVLDVKFWWSYFRHLVSTTAIISNLCAPLNSVCYCMQQCKNHKAFYRMSLNKPWKKQENTTTSRYQEAWLISMTVSKQDECGPVPLLEWLWVTPWPLLP